MPIRVTELEDYAGQPTVRVQTPSATWFFHRRGGGFASIVDPHGNDWISFNSAPGSRGQYRGLPNMVHPGAGFHPGGDMCVTRLGHVSADLVSLDVATMDQLWRCTWEIDALEATMTLMARPEQSYWLLYEGTPGGNFDEHRAFVEDAAGQRQTCSVSWERRLPEPRGVWFGDDRCEHGLYLIDATNRGPDVVDSYWPMDGAMTVFGFGRTLKWMTAWRRLTETPCVLRVGIAPVVAIRARAFGPQSRTLE